MASFPIGVLLDSLRLPVDEALDKAAALGLEGIQIYATRGELSPEALTPGARRELREKIRARGLTVSALCGDLGKGFGKAALNPGLIEQSKRILDLAGELGTNIITTHIGVVPADPAHERYRVMQDACGELARYADAAGAHFAVETGPERAETLRAFLDSLGSKGVAVNLDPANFVMVTGDDPVAAVYTLRDYIVHTHAKDGRKLLDKDPEIIYGIDVEAEIASAQAFVELPLGQGDVDFAGWLRALGDIGYRGFLTIEREVGQDPAGDIRLAADFLRETLSGL